MRIADIGGCAVKLNPLFLAVMVLAALTGYLSIFLLSFAVVLLHECCHALAARSFGFAVREVELLPFGGVARIEGLFELDPTAEVVIAAAGPACNLILLMVAVSLDRFLALPPQWITLFIDVNLGMAALNLLPALPLDGGRMLRGLLSRHFDLIKVTRLCSWAGMAAAAGLAGVFLWASMNGSINLSIALMALFLFLAAFRELKQAPFLIYKGLSGKRESLMRKESLPVRHIMARQGMELGSLVRRFTPGWYHMVTVVDDECRPLGAIDEEQIIAALYRAGSSATVGEAAGKRAR